MKCLEDATILKNFIEKDRMYDFLVGVNVEFDQVQIQILGKKDVPSLEEAISMIHAKESQRSVILEPQLINRFALATKKDHHAKNQNDSFKNLGKNNQGKESKDNL